MLSLWALPPHCLQRRTQISWTFCSSNGVGPRMQQPVPHPVADSGILPKPRVPGSRVIADGLNVQDGTPQPGLEAFRGWVLNGGFPGFTLQSLCSGQTWLLPVLCTGLRGLGWYFPKDQLSN